MSNDPTSLDRLHDVIAPAPAPGWPPAPGWDWVMGAAAVVFLVLAIRGLLRWQRNRYRREALRELDRISPALSDASRRGPAIVAIAVVLKRTALSAWPREDVASLSGRRWLAFLDETSSGEAFSRGDGSLFERVAYGETDGATLTEDQSRHLLEMARRWVGGHRAGTPRSPVNLTTPPRPPPRPSSSNPNDIEDEGRGGGGKPDELSIGSGGAW